MLRGLRSRLSLLNIGVAAEVFLSAPSVFICGLPVARSQRARERSIRLFIQRFMVVNLPMFFRCIATLNCWPGVPILSFILRTCCASQFPERLLPDFPASAYFLTRNQLLKWVISYWKIWTNTTPRIQLPATHSLPTHDIVGEGLQIESQDAVKIDTTIGAKTLC